MAQDSWYYRQSDGETSGPISFEELFTMAHERKLTPQMEVRNGEAGNWFPASEIGGLFDSGEAGNPELSLDDFSIVDSTFDMESKENLPSMEGFSIVEEEDKLSSELESQLPRFATLEAVRSKHQNVRWFCRVLNQELGPMSAEDLMQMLFDGELAPNDEVKSSAEPEWVPARTVVFLSSSGSDLDVLDAEDADAEQFVPATGEAVADESAAEADDSTAAAAPEEKQEEQEPAAVEPPKPPILKVRSRQKWYCKLGGMGYGPIEAHKIKMWAEQQRIEPDDLLKLGKKGDWFEAWQIEALQLKQPSAEQPAEESAAPETTAAAETTPAAAVPAQEIPPSPAAMPASAPVAATPPPAARPKPKVKVARSNPFEALGPMMDPKILGGVGGVIALIAILFFVPLGGLFSAGGGTELAKFKAIHQEFLALQQKKASETEWSSFKTKVQAEIDPLVQDLEKSASSDRPQLQHLLWAGRDYLPKMLDNAREKPSPDQERFEKQLKEADRIIN